MVQPSLRVVSQLGVYSAYMSRPETSQHRVIRSRPVWWWFCLASSTSPFPFRYWQSETQTDPRPAESKNKRLFAVFDVISNCKIISSSHDFLQQMLVAHDPPAYVTVTYWTSAGRVVMAAWRQEALAALAAKCPASPRCWANRTHRLKVCGRR